MRFICADCALFDGSKKIGLLRAIFHQIRGHHVIRAWKTNHSLWEVEQIGS